MNKYLKQYIFLAVILVLFLAVPYFLFTYAQDASDSATGCFIINQENLPSGAPLPPGCGNQSESATVKSVIALARKYINRKDVTYASGSPSRDWENDQPGQDTPPNFDCSGFVGWAWYWGSGGKVSMAGQTQTDWESTNPQYDKIVTKNESQMQPGDLIYFNNYPVDPESEQPGHVGLYVGKDPGSMCSANDCFMQFYQTGLPGNEISLQPLLSTVMGVIRIKIQ